MAREFHDTPTWKRAHLHPADPDFVEVDLGEARDKALALGLEKVAQFLAEAADSIRELALNFENFNK